MRRIDSELVEQLRAVMRADRSVARALKTLHHGLPADQRNKVVTIEYAKEAFGLSLHEASPIAGWDAEGTGEISDQRLDDLVMPAVASHRDQWDSEHAGR